MTATPKRERPSSPWLGAPLVIACVALVAVAPWLKATFARPTVNMIFAAAMICIMAYSLYFMIRRRRGQDEVHKAGTGFGAQWGMLTGYVVCMLLLVLPPVHAFVTAQIGALTGDPADQTTVTIAMIFGASGLFLLQCVSWAILNSIWWRARR